MAWSGKRETENNNNDDDDNDNNNDDNDDDNKMLMVLYLIRLAIIGRVRVGVVAHRLEHGGDVLHVLKSVQSVSQGCQMALFQTKNPDLDKFWRVLQWKMLVYLMAIWYV
jgi:hypothetical protein